jgi:hypothetical protein
MSFHKRLMCFEGTEVGLNFPDDGVNKQRNAQEQELIRERRDTA